MENDKEEAINDLNENKKIGFDDKPMPKKKGRIFKSLNKRSKIRKHTTRFVALAFISTLVTFTFAFLPIFSGLFIVFLMIIMAFIIMLPVLVTFGLILVSDGFRNWINETWGILEWFNDINANLPKIMPLFPYFGLSSLFVSLIAIILSIAGRKKEKKGYITYIVTTIICFIVSLVFVLLYYTVGFNYDILIQK